MFAALSLHFGGAADGGAWAGLWDGGVCFIECLAVRARRWVTIELSGVKKAL